MGNAYASYPVFALNASKGSLLYGGGTIANGCPITFCGDGLNRWEATSVQDERSATCFSQRIGDSIAELLRYRRYEDGILHFHQPTSELFLCCEDKMYVCNTLLNAWYVYDGLYATAMCTVGDTLYIGDNYGRVVYPNDSVKTLKRRGYRRRAASAAAGGCSRPESCPTRRNGRATAALRSAGRRTRCARAARTPRRATASPTPTSCTAPSGCRRSGSRPCGCKSPRRPARTHAFIRWP